MADLRWAVMGTGRIAAGVLPKIAASKGNRVVAVASRDASRVRALCARSGLTESAAIGYETLLTHEEIDAVYVTLPHHLHAAWSLRLLDAGKHVLCEKPLCATRREAESIASAAARAGRLCCEGFMYMHHAQTARLVELARPAGPLGRITRIRSNRNVCNNDPYILSSRLSYELQGGALMDIGCYPLSLVLLVMGHAPDWSTLRASAEFGRWVGDATAGQVEKPRTPHKGLVDESCSFSFTFPGGAVFEGECSFSKGAPNGASVFYEMIGERGSVNTTHPFSPDATRQTLLIESDGVAREEIFENCGDKFINQFERFARATRGEAPPLPSMEWSAMEAEAIERIHTAIGLRWGE